MRGWVGCIGVVGGRGCVCVRGVVGVWGGWGGGWGGGCVGVLVVGGGGGGGGESFSYALLDVVRRPYFLAGGLSPENIGAVMAAVQPFAFDVSSGVETEKRKDEHKIMRIVASVRNSMKEEAHV